MVTEERRGGLVWVDARGLDAEQIARSALEVLRGLGLANVRVGIGETAIIAELVAGGSCWSLADAGGTELPSSSISQPQAPATSHQPAVIES
ncbi:MAG TPA: hypothetical protein VFD73_12940, partial [Gemmatimonadales bacterium]|nr:hypothetical protein [Gemmatimonadales bacterium]